MKNYIVERISTNEGKEYIIENHYSHGCHNRPSPCFGLFDKTNLIGVLVFATPCSENVRASIFGKEYKDKVTELHRLHIQDVTPKNTESWFISKCLKELKRIKPRIEAVVSFADSTEGHNGTIYKATNAIFYGMSAPAIFYLDQTGRLRHPRQNGKNILKKEAISRGWVPTKRQAKYRYLWLLAGKKRKKTLKKMLKVKQLEYIK